MISLLKALLFFCFPAFSAPCCSGTLHAESSGSSATPAIAATPAVAVTPADPGTSVVPGAARLELYLPLLEGKRIALVANHTSLVANHTSLPEGTRLVKGTRVVKGTHLVKGTRVVKGTHLVDTLLSRGISREQMIRVFAPEHGFRGDQADGQMVKDGADPVTGITVTSLYGENKKPSPESLSGVELVLFDLQDVGVRFYTYISTLHYVMESCAEQGIPLVVLDRPNPNGGYVDGPLLEQEFTSFVGMHPVPVVYGLTIGELAGMINGEGWLKDGIQCELTVIPCSDYFHGKTCSMLVAPSPNLPNGQAIRLYPSTCFFEGTMISEGRGTPWPFQVYGHPDLEGDFVFTPRRIPGVSEYPKHEGIVCRGRDLRSFNPAGGWDRIRLEWILDAYRKFPRKEEFFRAYFDKLAGTASLRQQIKAGWDEKKIRASWEKDLERFRAIRKNYLIYD